MRFFLEFSQLLAYGTLGKRLSRVSNFNIVKFCHTFVRFLKSLHKE
jgi:hypothetical protein